MHTPPCFVMGYSHGYSWYIKNQASGILNWEHFRGLLATPDKSRVAEGYLRNLARGWLEVSADLHVGACRYLYLSQCYGYDLGISRQC
jgi:hypothetical protein